MELTIQDLTLEAFAPYGIALSQPERPQDASGPGWAWWGENALLPTVQPAYALGYLALAPAELRFDWAERHHHSPELIFPAGADCLVYMATSAPGELPQLEAFQVFRVRAGQGVLLNPGVWHGAPLALDRPLQAFVLLRQHTGQEDVELMRFPERPVVIR